MRDIKVVGYGNVSAEDERLIENYLNEKLDRVTVFSVDTAVQAANKEIARLRAKVAELEADD